MPLKRELIESLIRKYERFVAPFTFVVGFVFDTLTMNRIDLLIDHLVILFYLVLAGFAIIILNLYEFGRIRFQVFDILVPFVPIVMQFAFGGLLSAFVIFYTKSAAFGKSWFFLSVLAVLLVANEKFRKRYQRFVFQMSIFFTTLFSYSIFALPIFLQKIGDDVFLLSGFLSLGLITLFVLFLFRLVSRQIKENLRVLALSVGSIYFAFNFLYFLNIIPPAPLSLKESGIYHSVERNGGKYLVSYESAPKYLFFYETSPVYHWKIGEAVYYFSSVFVPTDLSLPILHRWSFYDENRRRWIRHESIKFPITGGRDGGYRGYSFKTAIEPGRWRVEVITETGQVLGRETFRVLRAEIEPILKVGLK